jgi:hypothetical protein
MEQLMNLNDQLKKEADKILYDQGLFHTLSKYGVPHISGSYVLDLMTWRDLDIYLETPDIEEQAFFDLGKNLLSLLQPVKMHYRNERMGGDSGLPRGLYWGIYLGNERQGAWKIDTWAVDASELACRMAYCKAIKEKLTEKCRRVIMQIKSRCWKDPLYRKTYLSTDIYKAVLEMGIINFDEFKNYLDILKANKKS